MARWCATTAPGLEPIVRDEITSQGGDPIDLPFGGNGLVGFEVDGHETGRQLLHRLRTVHRLGPVLETARVDPADPFETLAQLVEDVDWSPWIDERTRWAFRCSRHGEHPFASVDVERRIGGALDEVLTDDLPRRPPVDLEDPDALVRLHLGHDGGVVLWLDLVGTRSLHRRGYHRYQHPAGMKATLAAALVHVLDWDPGTRLVDPMAGSATLPIEAAWSALGASPVHLRAADLLVHRVPRWRGQAPERGRPAWEGPRPSVSPWLVVGDHAPNHLEGAKRNLDAAGLFDDVHSVADGLDAVGDVVDRAGALVANPPYGIRSGEGDLTATYDALLETADAVLAPGGAVGLLTARDDLVHHAVEGLDLGIRTSLPVHHGRLTIRLMTLAR